MVEFVRRFVIPAAYAVLPAPMGTPDATRMLLAITWQESRLKHRRQIGGPARGFAMFETNGVSGVLAHPASKDLALNVLRDLQYTNPPTPYGVHSAVEHNDILCFALARLLLWTDPAPMPITQEDGWRIYQRCWRPGKPHPETWAQAWTVAS